MKHPSLTQTTVEDAAFNEMEPVSDFTQPVSMLTADLPFGLPSLEEVKSLACVRIGATDETWTQYLCATDESSWEYDAYDACEISPEFSDYYGVEVALCLRQNR